MNRLPTLPTSTDTGLIYVVRRGNAHKIGFTRRNLKRRVKACDGTLVLTIPVRQRPATIEAAIHRHFVDKLTEGPGFTTEWFALNGADLEWLNKLAAAISSGMVQHPLFPRNIPPVAVEPVQHCGR